MIDEALFHVLDHKGVQGPVFGVLCVVGVAVGAKDAARVVLANAEALVETVRFP